MEVVINGATVERDVHPLPLYGHHHPNRSTFGLNGGACPSKGGDWASYPWGDAGGGWPINYQEITPFCDGFAIDMKAWANLFVDTWDDPTFGVGNSGFTSSKIQDVPKLKRIPKMYLTYIWAISRAPPTYILSINIGR